MDLVRDGQVSLNTLCRGEYDLVLCACGFETRATHIASKLARPGPQRFALTFPDRPVLSRKRNEQLFRKLGFELLPADGGSEQCVADVLKPLLALSSRPRKRVLVDYSCMTRVWYAGVIRLLNEAAWVSDVEVVFGYSPSTFLPPPVVPAPNAFMGPLIGFASFGLPNLATSLVIGLGYERERAMGLFHFVEAVDTYLFYADPVYDERFLTVVRRNNREIMRVVGEQRILTYPLSDMQGSAGMLHSLLRALTSRGRVIVAPLGPKPFGLISMLFSVRLPNCDVWRVSGGTSEEPIDREPIGDILAYATLWSRSADDSSSPAPGADIESPSR